MTGLCISHAPDECEEPGHLRVFAGEAELPVGSGYTAVELRHLVMLVDPDGVSAISVALPVAQVQRIARWLNERERQPVRHAATEAEG